MALADLIEEFKETSGRLDLSDSEITKVLNRGSRLLDRRSLQQKTERRAHSLINAGDYCITTSPDLRSIQAVWAMTTTERWELGEESFANMRAVFSKQPSGVDTGKPKHYTQTSVTLGPNGNLDGSNPNSEFFLQWAGDIVPGNEAGYRGLVIWPIPDEQTVIEVIGKFYTPALEDKIGCRDNRWSLNHDQLLIMAALITLDRNYRNTAGASALYSEIDDELKMIYYDDIEEESNKASALGGSEYGILNGE